MHSFMLKPGCTAYEPRPLWFRIFCMAVILSGKQQNGDATRAYSVSCSSKTPDANMRSPYGDALQVCLVTCVLRVTTVRDRELVKCISSFR